MPASAEKIWAQLGIEKDDGLRDFASMEKWGGIKPGTRVAKGDILFPRVEVQK